MEENKEMKKYVCKFCNKKFSSGKSLGGHIRIHSNESVVDSNSNESLSYASEIDQEHKDGAFSLMMMSRDSNLMAESSDNSSMILETKLSSRKKLNIVNVKHEVGANENGISICDSDSDDSDYYLNGPKKSESDSSVDGSLKNTFLRNTNVSHSKSRMVDKESGTKKKSKGHKCPFCFKVFKSGQALGGHKRSHSIRNQFEMRVSIDLNLPPSDIAE